MIAAATVQLPCPVACGLDYYRQRALDFQARHRAPAALSPPDYYLNYGDRYARRFMELRPRFSPPGREWVETTLFRLQQMMEAKRAADPADFARLEENSRAFKCFAFGTHAAAYIQAGIDRLSWPDFKLIIGTIAWCDWLSLTALPQVASVVGHLVLVRSSRFNEVRLLWGYAGLGFRPG
jgi:hypothetical protein